MESHYNYFNRDISWLSFNHRVLLEADDDTLPLFERINFIAIYSSNLEEFYQVRVAEHKAVASGGKSEDMTVDEAHCPYPADYGYREPAAGRPCTHL